MVGNGSVEYHSCKKKRTVLSIPSVHSDPRHPPSRHVDPCSLSTSLQDPLQMHLLKPNYLPVPVTANFLSLTTLHRPFPAASRLTRLHQLSSTSFTLHWTR